MGEAAVHSTEDSAGPPVLAFTRLPVDIGAMDDFIAMLQAEIDQNLEPYSNGRIGAPGPGRPIARESASVPESAFRQQYYVAVDTAVQGLRSYLQSTRV